MVLLDMFYKKEPANILVTHFNHGTRDSADADEKFVKEKCTELMVPFESRKIILGEGVSEEEAREKILAKVEKEIDSESLLKYFLLAKNPQIKDKAAKILFIINTKLIP